ncbi:hypothetical protein PJE062_4834 [Pseudovibrio sp. JE062]|nr:hypothetical protein PJE062_4834 [Pseudovibrio sp. JE062]
MHRQNPMQTQRASSDVAQLSQSTPTLADNSRKQEVIAAQH